VSFPSLLFSIQVILIRGRPVPPGGRGGREKGYRFRGWRKLYLEKEFSQKRNYYLKSEIVFGKKKDRELSGRPDWFLGEKKYPSF